MIVNLWLLITKKILKKFFRVGRSKKSEFVLDKNISRKSNEHKLAIVNQNVNVLVRLDWPDTFLYDCILPFLYQSYLVYSSKNIE